MFKDYWPTFFRNMGLNRLKVIPDPSETHGQGSRYNESQLFTCLRRTQIMFEVAFIVQVRSFDEKLPCQSSDKC